MEAFRRKVAALIMAHVGERGAPRELPTANPSTRQWHRCDQVGNVFEMPVETPGSDQGLRAGINRAIGDTLIFRPKGNQTPSEPIKGLRLGVSPDSDR